MSLLIVNTLPEGNKAALDAIRTLRDRTDRCGVINTCEMELQPCVGCNACWLVTPGICSRKDGYEELLKAYLEYEATVFLSGTALNFVDHRMKHIIDRFGEKVSTRAAVGMSAARSRLPAAALRSMSQRPTACGTRS